MAAMEPVEEQPARKSHSIAIEGFDGKTEIVEADELRVCVPTKECIQFWATIVACFVVIGLGVFFMIFQGPTSAYYSVGLAMIGLGSGVLIPGTLPLFRYFDNMQQAPIMVSWHRQGRPDSRPKVGMTTQRIQADRCQVVSPSSCCRSSPYQKVACLHFQKSRLEFNAFHKH